MVAAGTVAELSRPRWTNSRLGEFDLKFNILSKAFAVILKHDQIGSECQKSSVHGG